MDCQVGVMVSVHGCDVCVLIHVCLMYVGEYLAGKLAAGSELLQQSRGQSGHE